MSSQIYRGEPEGGDEPPQGGKGKLFFIIFMAIKQRSAKFHFHLNMSAATHWVLSDNTINRNQTKFSGQLDK